MKYYKIVTFDSDDIGREIVTKSFKILKKQSCS